MASSPTVDVNVPRFTQGTVAVLTALAFLIRWPGLVAVTFVILAVPTVGGSAVAPLGQLYSRVIRPWIQPDGPDEYEPAGPPRFAQTLAAMVLGVATVALAAGWAGLGWGLTLVVAGVAALAAAARICLGCMLYERLAAR